MITNVANIKFKKRVKQAPSHVRRRRERYVWCQESHTVLDHGTTAEVERDEMGDRSCDSSYTRKSQLAHCQTQDNCSRTFSLLRSSRKYVLRHHFWI